MEGEEDNVIIIDGMDVGSSSGSSRGLSIDHLLSAINYFITREVVVRVVLHRADINSYEEESTIEGWRRRSEVLMMMEGRGILSVVIQDVWLSILHLSITKEAFILSNYQQYISHLQPGHTYQVQRGRLWGKRKDKKKRGGGGGGPSRCCCYFYNDCYFCQPRPPFASPFTYPPSPSSPLFYPCDDVIT